LTGPLAHLQTEHVVLFEATEGRRAKPPVQIGRKFSLVVRFFNSTHIARLEAEGPRTALSVMAGLVPAIHAAPFPDNLLAVRRLDDVAECACIRLR
jgi:hypothetical protein